MPDGSTTANLFDNVKNIGETLQNSWPGNAAVGLWNVRLTLSSWPISVRPSGETEIYDYFLIELNGQSSLQGARKPVGYGINVGYDVLNADGLSQGPPPGMLLIASSPNTSQASVSFDDGISQKISGSFGFSGDGPSISVETSTTITNSTTRTVSDLQILNRSGVDDNLTCNWQYIITPGSLESEGETPLLAQMLVRRPHSSDPLQIQVEAFAYFSNDGLANNLNWDGLSQYVLDFATDNPSPLDKGNARIAMLYPLTIAAPPPPAAS